MVTKMQCRRLRQDGISSQRGWRRKCYQEVDANVINILTTVACARCTACVFGTSGPAFAAKPYRAGIVPSLITTPPTPLFEERVGQWDDVVYVGWSHIVVHTARPGRHALCLPHGWNVIDATT